MASSCKRKDIMHPVELIPSEDITPGYEFNPGVSQSVVTTVGKRKIVLKSVSDSYGLLPNADLLGPFEAELKKAFKFNAIYRQTDYARFFVSYAIDMAELQVRPGDTIHPKMDFMTSYDTTIAQNIGSRGGRKLCVNKIFMNAPDIDIKFKHTSGAIDRGALTYAVEKIREYITDFPRYAEVFKDMDSRSVPQFQDRIIEVINATKFPKSSEIFDAVLARLKLEMDMLQTKTATDWLIYNALNYQLNHNQKIGLEYHFKDKIDKSIFHTINQN